MQLASCDTGQRSIPLGE